MTMDTKNVDIFIYTEREGLMSAVGHDLQLSAESFDVERDGAKVRVEVDASSLKVRGCLVDGEVKSVKTVDRKMIERNIRKDVLQAKKHPRVVFDGEFTGDGDDVSLSGTLEIVGRQQPVELTFRKDENRWHGETTIDQTRWGIEPYTAFLGTLKLKPKVRIEVEAPASLELTG